MILRYPQAPSSFNSTTTTNTTNNNSNNLGCSLSSLFPTCNNHHHQNIDGTIGNCSSNNSIMISEVSLHESSMNNDNSIVLMEEPCTPCSSWLSSLTSLHQLSLNTTTTTPIQPQQHQFPSSSKFNDHLESSCTTNTNTTSSSQIFNNTSNTMPPPPSHSSLINSTPSNNSARDVFEQEFQIRCNKHRKVNQATRDLSSLTPCSGTSVSPLSNNNDSNGDMVECLVITQTQQSERIVNSATAKIVSTVLSNVLSKSLELKQKKITKQRSGFKRLDMPKIIIPNEMSGSDPNSSVFIKSCSLVGKKK